ncbi:MAG TPA: hypothetical protein VFU31_24325 [Candidatus Binatia bacterium]|nr:hypothetical protein [Candidatus Binatia bacterium]
MRTVRNLLWFAVGVLLVVLYAVNAYPHGGGLDAYGCHYNRKAGGHHCHKGEFASQWFTSPQEMLQKVNQDAQPIQKAPPSQKSSLGGSPVGTTPTGKTIYEGPRGGRYHHSASGKKVYERRRWSCAKSHIAAKWRTVRRVVDGDTLLLENRERVRRIGVDTPRPFTQTNPLSELARKPATSLSRADHPSRSPTSKNSTAATRGQKREE